MASLRNRRICVSFLLSLLLIVVVPNAFVEAFEGICSKSFVASKCANPPTADLVDLKAYEGTWYQIGSTARTFIQRESVSCVTANYKLDQTAHNKYGRNLTITNAGIQLLGPLASSAVSTQIGQAIPKACNSVRSLCRQLAPTNTIWLAISKVNHAIKYLKGADVTKILKASTNIQNSFNDIERSINKLAGILEFIQQRTADLIQRVQKKQFILASLDGLIKASQPEFEKIATRISTIESERNKIVQIGVLQKEKTMKKSNVALELQDATTLLLKENTKVNVTFHDIKKEILSVSNTIKTRIIKEENITFPRIQIQATGVQNLGSHGKIDVYTPIPNSSLTFKAPYWILVVTGSANTGYDAALVYSCTEVGGNLIKSLFVLSRKPTLSQDVVTNFLTLAKNYGFDFECEDRFIYTQQNSPFCLK